MIGCMLGIMPLICSCNYDSGADFPGAPPKNDPIQNENLTASFVGKFYRLPENTLFKEKSNTEWADTVWINERIYNQIAITNIGDALSQFNIEITEFRNEQGDVTSIPFNLFTVGYVKGDAAPCVDNQPNPRTTALVADALLPGVNGKVDGGSSKCFWLSADIPQDLKPGKYSGSIKLLNGNDELGSLSISLLVTNHKLPSAKDWVFHLDIWQFPFRLASIVSDNGSKMEPFSPQHLAMLTPFYSMLADAGQKCVSAYIKDGAFNLGETMIDWTKLADGSWSYDYSKFDRFVEFMFGLRIDSQINCFSVAGWNNKIGYTDQASGTYKYLDVPIGSEVFNQTWNDFLNDFRQHLTSKGWMGKAVLYMDENRNDDMRKIVKMIRDNGSDWKIGLSGRYIDSDIEKEFYNYSAIIGCIPNTTNITVPVFYTSCSQMHPNNYLTPLTPTAEMTWMAWHAMAMGYKGYQRWAYDNWLKDDPFDAQDRLNTSGDFHFIYRSGNGSDATPVSSIRWEMLRDGIQDYEKCRQLDYRAMRQTTLMFKDYNATGAENLVKVAQAQIKKLSLK